MFKKSFIGIVASAVVFLHVMAANASEIEVGFSGSSTLATSDFITHSIAYNVNGTTDYELKEKLEYKNGFGISAHLGMNFPSDSFAGIECGRKTAYFGSMLLPIMYPEQNLSMQIIYSALRIDKSFAFKENFEILFGAYGGIANIDLYSCMSYNRGDSKQRYIFNLDFNRVVFGIRSGFEYILAKNAALSLNYLMTYIPLSYKNMQGDRFPGSSNIPGEIDFRFTDFTYVSHGLEFGFKWYVGLDE